MTTRENFEVSVEKERYSITIWSTDQKVDGYSLKFRVNENGSYSQAFTRKELSLITEV